MRRSFSTLLLVSMVALAGCGGGDDDPPADPDAAGGGDPDAGGGGNVQVVSCTGATIAATITTVGLTAFSPEDTTINAGEVIRFMPAGSHNMTSGAPGAPTGDFATTTAQETCLQFDVAGDYPFFCSVHPNMIGSVTVN